MPKKKKKQKLRESTDRVKYWEKCLNIRYTWNEKIFSRKKIILLKDNVAFNFIMNYFKYFGEFYELLHR